MLCQIVCVALAVASVRGNGNDGAPKVQENVTICKANLKKIHRLIRLYDHQARGLTTADIDSLMKMSKFRDIFVCPSDTRTTNQEGGPSSYEIVGNYFEHLRRAPANAVAVAFEKRRNHGGGRFVLFYDGSVRAYSDAEFEDLRERAFIASH